MKTGAGEFSYEVRHWGKLPRDMELGLVSSVAVDSRDRVYLFNRGRHPVIILDHDGRFISAWGEGIVTDAHGMFIGPDDRVYLVDRDAHLVLQFDVEGKLLLVLGTKDLPST